jgi:hypothetical protein
MKMNREIGRRANILNHQEVKRNALIFSAKATVLPTLDSTSRNSGELLSNRYAQAENRGVLSYRA